MNKKFVGVGIGALIVVIFLVSLQLYRPSETTNQSNVQSPTIPPKSSETTNQSNVQSPTITQTPAVKTGRNFVISVNESMSVSAH